MKFFLLIILFPLIVKSQITEEALLDLSTESHQDIELNEALQLFTFARDLKVTAKLIYHQDKKLIRKPPSVGSMQMKKLGKNLFYATFQLPILEKPYHVCISYDEKTGLYHKHMLTPLDEFLVLQGVAIPDSRSIHWYRTGSEERAINIESYTDTSFIAKDVILDKKGDVLMILKVQGEVNE